jgi:4-hydroxy-tetrahydrodipicolinate reductase
VTTDRLRLAIIGMGKMGHAIDELSRERGFEVVARIDPALDEGGVVSAETLRGAQVAVEFSVPDVAAANVRSCIAARCPVVVGTTGWYDKLPEVTEEVRRTGGALLYAPNFSVGVNLFTELVEAAGRLLKGATTFDVHLLETHHTAKKDAPSGTAKLLADIAQNALSRDVPVTSVRTGHVPGTHELIFDAPFETLRLEHVARDRRVFADGALAAARWLVGKQGVFTMKDVLSTPGD